MKQSILIVFIISICFSSHAQELYLEWAVASNHTYDWDIDNEGKILRTRNFDESITINGETFTSTDGLDILIEKVDYNGSTIDVRHIASKHDKPISDLVLNSDNEMILMASFRDSLDIGLNKTEHWIYTQDSMSRFLACYTSNFDLKWVSIIKAQDQDIHSECLLALEDGSVLVSGGYIDSLGLINESEAEMYLNEGTHSYLVKLDSSGKIAWYNPNFYAGQIARNRVLDISNGNGTLSNASFFFSEIASFNLEDGSVLWNHMFQMTIHAHTIDAEGNIYVTGGFDEDDQTDFDPGPNTVGFDPISQDIFLLKLDAQGNYLWAKHLITGDKIDTGTDIWIKGEEIFVTGCIQRDGDFDPSDEVFELNAAGNEDAFIASYDLFGNFNWAKILKGSSIDIGFDIRVIEDTILLSGIFIGTLDFDLQEESFVLESEDEGKEVSGFFVKYINCTSENCTTSIEEEKVADVKIYPNPTTDQLQIQSDLHFSSYRIVDLEGNVVLREETLNKHISTINVSTLTSGLYILDLYQGDLKESYKWIKL